MTSFNAEYQLGRRALAVAPTLFRLGVDSITWAASAATPPGTAGEQTAVFDNSPRGKPNQRAEQAALPETSSWASTMT